MSLAAILGNCRRAERYECDLDGQFAKDQMASLLRRFEYGRDEEARNISPRHRIPINGDRYTGTATLKAALNLYRKFSESWPKGKSATGAWGFRLRFSPAVRGSGSVFGWRGQDGPSHQMLRTGPLLRMALVPRRGVGRDTGLHFRDGEVAE